jgi:hypothetical protein
VIRDDRKWTIATDKLVLDDLIILKAGDQVPADCQVLSGSLEVNESLLTGEADNLSKAEGDELFSGSFVAAGEAECKVIHVGSDNYASKITNEAKEYKKHHSELRNSLNAILRVISIIIVPIGGLLFYKQYFVVGESLKNSVVSTVAAVLGMIPEGLVLLTSIALTIGAVTLAMKKTLVQELYCKMQYQRLEPKTIVDYTREPYIYRPGNVRVTFDYDIRTGMSCTDFLNPKCITVPAGDAPILLEVKWDEYLPDIIKAAVQTPGRRVTAFSKYGQCRIYG